VNGDGGIVRGIYIPKGGRNRKLEKALEGEWGRGGEKVSIILLPMRLL